MGQSRTFSYDAYGKKHTDTDFADKVTRYVYDADDRLTQTQYDDGSSVDFTYAPNGELQSVTDQHGTTTYTYGNDGEVLRIDNPDGSFIAYAYDAKGRLTSLQVPNRTVTYGYDAQNRLSSVTDESGTTHYEYNQLGQLTRTRYANATQTDYVYDPLGLVTSITHTDATGTVFASFDYTYDDRFNRTRIVEHNGRTIDYAYDEQDRLIAEMVSNDPSSNDSVVEYEYDAMGNRLARITANGTTDYTYDANDRLISDGTTLFSYDDAGNILSDGTITYGYDVQNRLISAMTPQHQIAYDYDYLGNRLGKTIDGDLTRYLINPLAEHAQVVRASNVTATTDYTYGLRMINQQRNQQKSFFHADALGSTRALSDLNGHAVNNLTYSPFGRLIHQTGTDMPEFLFTGEQFDEETNNYYLRARYYNPTTARFTQYDTFCGYPSDPMSLNHYLYANSNPLKYVDPSGHMNILTASLNIF